jgi:hypothetical protein
MNYMLDINALGTVADWFMVAVTAITAFYLYKTLQSQKEVQNTQTKLFKIESIRFRESIKPLLNYKVSSQVNFNPNEEDKRILTIEVTNETDSIALEISSVHSENSTQVFIPTGFANMQKHLKKGDRPLLLHFLMDSKKKVSEWVVFALTYQDVSGTKYKQGVCCIDDSHGTEINPFLPEIVN